MWQLLRSSGSPAATKHATDEPPLSAHSSAMTGVGLARDVELSS